MALFTTNMPYSREENTHYSLFNSNMYIFLCLWEGVNHHPNVPNLKDFWIWSDQHPFSDTSAWDIIYHTLSYANNFTFQISIELLLRKIKVWLEWLWLTSSILVNQNMKSHYIRKSTEETKCDYNWYIFRKCFYLALS